MRRAGQFLLHKAAKIIEREHGSSPMFVYIYLDANHFPWDYRLRPDLLPQWKDPGNGPLVDEYLRRQELSAQNYQAFLAQLKLQFRTTRSSWCVTATISRPLAAHPRAGS